MMWHDRTKMMQRVKAARPSRKAVQRAIAAQAPTDVECKACDGCGRFVHDITHACHVCNGSGRVPWQPAVRAKRRAAKIVEESLEALGEEKSERGED